MNVGSTGRRRGFGIIYRDYFMLSGLKSFNPGIPCCSTQLIYNAHSVVVRLVSIIALVL
jgi:hypothetical protein